ncbi:unnamed protein product [Penicillium nalgiovense]|uniref:Uncharacterized protein n=2 Tax=Penicillium TaxID=5073 RepID=A0A1V6X398_PENNA|nr:hypothetical protein VN97_g10628 [Penicillium thymicola]OQE69601.1 hypothetical protein PENNAL_c0132G05817 [Penicillium nalgiovense]CAG7991084.1 unnamed protein product [Penicillium nalgiovense]CAG8000782.1 unnamed protein product [Penicillium nalgiovense]CAG8013512.1 unnamed protein product [Penicillium nalgiovense]
MRLSLIVMLASVYARATLGGTLEIIDIDNKCAIWSYDNHGCTGSSAFFSQLDGDDCSRLDKVANSTHPGYPMRGAEACGTENDSSAAWVKVEKTGVITFYNFQGDNSTCTLDNELKHGSRCTASDLIPSTKSSSTESSSTESSSTKSSSTKSSSTKSSSTKSSSALTTLDSSSSAMEPSSTTFQTAPISDCS